MLSVGSVSSGDFWYEPLLWTSRTAFVAALCFGAIAAFSSAPLSLPLPALEIAFGFAVVAVIARVFLGSDKSANSPLTTPDRPTSRSGGTPISKLKELIETPDYLAILNRIGKAKDSRALLADIDDASPFGMLCSQIKEAVEIGRDYIVILVDEEIEVKYPIANFANITKEQLETLM